jgi:hypothetical protein
MFEKGAYNATETYTWNEEAQRIDIDFHFNKDSFDGPQKSIPQKAFVYNENTKAEWRVQSIWPRITRTPSSESRIASTSGSWPALRKFRKPATNSCCRK